jgi:predicted nucleic acid-binding protein
MASRGVLRTVPDTNVVLAAEISPGPKSPSAECFDRWKKREFLILYSEDTLTFPAAGQAK